MNTNYTYTQIANSYDLWLELVDIDGVMTREQFDCMPVNELVAMMTDMCGAEQADITQIEIYENNVHATDARYAKGGWETGAALSDDDDASDAIYAAIEAQIEDGQTEGKVGAFAWNVAA